jgi:PAS domain S-box-containing protein
VTFSTGLNQNELAKFYELSSDLFCVTTIEGITISVNHAFVTALGFDKAFFYGRSLLDLVHPDDLPDTNLALTTLTSDTHIIQITNRVITFEGNYVLLSWRAVYDPSNKRIYATARNVSEEVKNKNHHDHLLRALFSETIVSQTDRRGIITEVNDKFCHISGYSKSELLGKTHRVINSGMHSKLFFKGMWKQIARGNIWEGTITNRKKDGSLYYVRSIIVPMKDHNDTITHYVSIRQDITDSVINQVELNKTLTILTETSASAKVGGWELRLSDGELTWTEETFKILEVENRVGYTPTLDKGISLFSDAHQPIIEKAVNDALTLGTPYALELLAKTAKGNERWVFTKGKANYLDGQIYSISGTIQDIHDKKLAELELVQQKQRSIQNSKLASLGELAASIAHEINNPLGIISGSAQLLELERVNKNPEAVLKKAETIIRSSKRIEHITKSLRRFAHSSLDDRNSIVDIHKLLQEALSLTKPNIKRHWIDLNLVGASSAQIRCNEIEIEQVFINLINNAVDAVKDLDERWIEVIVSDQPNHVRIDIVDSGRGIEPSAKAQLFEPFYTTKPKGEGTGLGLSICKQICESHNATLWFNDISPYTCFSILFEKVE